MSAAASPLTPPRVRWSAAPIPACCKLLIGGGEPSEKSNATTTTYSKPSGICRILLSGPCSLVTIFIAATVWAPAEPGCDTDVQQPELAFFPSNDTFPLTST